MLVTILIVGLFVIAGGLILYGARAYRGGRAGREVLWTGVAALLLVVLFAYIR